MNYDTTMKTYYSCLAATPYYFAAAPYYFAAAPYYFAAAPYYFAAALLALAVAPCSSAAADGAWPPENFRGVLDLSTRHVLTEGDYSVVNHIGYDARYVFSNDSGDIGTLLVQPFIQLASGSSEFDDELQWRMTNFNFTGFGRVNVRVGHFELPFGLEQVIPTNGEVRQVQNSAALGLVNDWGISLNGSLPSVEYEVGFLRGGGNSISTDANGYFVGRVATPSERRFWIGLSGFAGELETSAGPQEQLRAGIDLGWRLPKGYSILAEFATGENDGDNVDFALAELDWTNLCLLYTSDAADE